MSTVDDLRDAGSDSDQGTGASSSPLPKSERAGSSPGRCQSPSPIFTVKFVDQPNTQRLQRLLRSAEFRLWPADAQAAARDAFERVQIAEAS